jgi:hypothetical protein
MSKIIIWGSRLQYVYSCTAVHVHCTVCNHIGNQPVSCFCDDLSRGHFSHRGWIRSGAIFRIGFSVSEVAKVGLRTRTTVQFRQRMRRLLHVPVLLLLRDEFTTMRPSVKERNLKTAMLLSCFVLIVFALPNGNTSRSRAHRCHDTLILDTILQVIKPALGENHPSVRSYARTQCQTLANLRIWKT